MNSFTFDFHIEFFSTQQIILAVLIIVSFCMFLSFHEFLLSFFFLEILHLLIHVTKINKEAVISDFISIILFT